MDKYLNMGEFVAVCHLRQVVERSALRTPFVALLKQQHVGKVTATSVISAVAPATQARRTQIPRQWGAASYGLRLS